MFAFDPTFKIGCTFKTSFIKTNWPSGKSFDQRGPVTSLSDFAEIFFNKTIDGVCNVLESFKENEEE